jgi:hypothetical protein
VLGDSSECVMISLDFLKKQIKKSSFNLYLTKDKQSLLIIIAHVSKDELIERVDEKCDVNRLGNLVKFASQQPRKERVE